MDNRFLNRTRYFTDSGIIGSKVFADRIYRDHFSSKHEKKPKIIQGLDGIYALKRLFEAVQPASFLPTSCFFEVVSRSA